MKYFRYIFTLIIFSLLFLSCNEQTAFTVPAVEFSGFTMGTTYNIKIAPNVGQTDNFETGKIKDSVDSLLNDVNKSMSTYIPESELSLFNTAKAGNWFEISDNLYEVLKTAVEVSDSSGGAFDITIGPLVNLWGFGPETKRDKLPRKKDITTRKRITGYHNLTLRDSTPAIKKRINDLYCDLSAIAKGFGVDKVSELLSGYGFKNYLVEIGGEVRTLGKNRFGKDWQIGISKPKQGFNIQEIINISGKSVATSGNYHNYFEVDGVRYSHMIDPRTGYPVTHFLSSVTVIHDQCMLADAYATTVTILGPEDGYRFALKMDIPAYMIIVEEDNYTIKMTPSFEGYLTKKEEEKQ